MNLFVGGCHIFFKCKIHGLTNIKKQMLTDEYDDYQRLCWEVPESKEHGRISDSLLIQDASVIGIMVLFCTCC